MMNKLTTVFLVFLIITGCASPSYLPEAEDIGMHPYGSHIKLISSTSKKSISGELIAIEGDQIIILTSENENTSKKIVTVKSSNYSRYRLTYAKGKNYWWTIPVFTLASLTHGWIAVISAPVNAIVTASVATGAMESFQYHGVQQLSYEKLKMFARFPQGIPEGIDIEKIK